MPTKYASHAEYASQATAESTKAWHGNQFHQLHTAAKAELRSGEADTKNPRHNKV